jgi:hypothetical protein
MLFVCEILIPVRPTRSVYYNILDKCLTTLDQKRKIGGFCFCKSPH